MSRHGQAAAATPVGAAGSDAHLHVTHRGILLPPRGARTGSGRRADGGEHESAREKRGARGAEADPCCGRFPDALRPPMIDTAAVVVAVTLTIIAAFALACAIVGCPPRRRDPNDSPITMVRPGIRCVPHAAKRADRVHCLTPWHSAQAKKPSEAGP